MTLQSLIERFESEVADLVPVSPPPPTDRQRAEAVLLLFMQVESGKAFERACEVLMLFDKVAKREAATGNLLPDAQGIADGQDWPPEFYHCCNAHGLLITRRPQRFGAGAGRRWPASDTTVAARFRNQRRG
jgi:hypothetical protein